MFSSAWLHIPHDNLEGQLCVPSSHSPQCLTLERGDKRNLVPGHSLPRFSSHFEFGTFCRDSTYKCTDLSGLCLSFVSPNPRGQMLLGLRSRGTHSRAQPTLGKAGPRNRCWIQALDCGGRELSAPRRIFEKREYELIIGRVWGNMTSWREART